MTEDQKLSADEREAIGNIALHISGSAGTDRLGVAVVAARAVLAARRDADRRVEEARVAERNSIWVMIRNRSARHERAKRFREAAECCEIRFEIEKIAAQAPSRDDREQGQ